MRLRGVAAVLVEPPLWIEGVERVHAVVSIDLCKNGRSPDLPNELIPAGNSDLGAGDPIRDLNVSVELHQVLLGRPSNPLRHELFEDAGDGKTEGLGEHPREELLVNLFRRAFHDGDTESYVSNGCTEYFPVRRVGESFGISGSDDVVTPQPSVRRRHCGLFPSESHSGDDEGARKGATTSLVDPDDDLWFHATPTWISGRVGR